MVGQFFIFRYQSKYAVFLSMDSPKKAYGVLALADPFEQLVGPYLPRLIGAVLLPFKEQIIYDGLLSGHNITFGGGVKRRLNEEYKEAKEAFGIITSLPFDGRRLSMTTKNEGRYRRGRKAPRTAAGRRPRHRAAPRPPGTSRLSWRHSSK